MTCLVFRSERALFCMKFLSFHYITRSSLYKQRLLLVAHGLTLHVFKTYESDSDRHTVNILMSAFVNINYRSLILNSKESTIGFEFLKNIILPMDILRAQKCIYMLKCAAVIYFDLPQTILVTEGKTIVTRYFRYFIFRTIWTIKFRVI